MDLVKENYAIASQETSYEQEKDFIRNSKCMSETNTYGSG
jgi:hypothetical protein